MDQAQNSKQRLLGQTLAEIEQICHGLNLPAYSAKQICEWIYKKRIHSIDQMTNLPKTARQKLIEQFEIGIYGAIKASASQDGTKKYLFATARGNGVEAAYIPSLDEEKQQATLCVSTQIGCKMGCLFCMTGKQGFQGQLSCNEIMNQIHSIDEHDKLTNLVFMGMGEPLDNYDETLKTLKILTAAWGYGWSPRRITLSSVGIIPNLIKFLQDSKSNLAISLHSPISSERAQLMPIENVYPIANVIEVLRKAPLEQRRRVSFEYILFDGINDQNRHIQELGKLLNGLNAHINLMRFHPIPGSPLKGSPEERIKKFQQELNAKGFITTLRASRGQDIEAACGLLSTLTP